MIMLAQCVCLPSFSPAHSLQDWLKSELAGPNVQYSFQSLQTLCSYILDITFSLLMF